VNAIVIPKERTSLLCDVCTPDCEAVSKRTGRHRTVRFNPATQGFPRLPRGKVYRHTCHNKYCSNAEHLTPSTYSENFLDTDIDKTGSKDYCVNGHRMDEANTRISKACPTHTPQRFCRTCQREWMRAYRLRKKVN
jgi:hypothetical protein